MVIDAMSPEDRIQEFEDIKRCILQIEKCILEAPAAFPNGVDIPDKRNNYFLKMYADKQGVYGTMLKDGVKSGIRIDQMIIEAEKHYLENNRGLELLVNAVQALGLTKSYDLGYRDLLITPNGYEYREKVLSLTW